MKPGPPEHLFAFLPGVRVEHLTAHGLGLSPASGESVEIRLYADFEMVAEERELAGPGAGITVMVHASRMIAEGLELEYLEDDDHWTAEHVPAKYLWIAEG